HRDGGCTIDGCTSQFRLEPHHIEEQANGGDHHPDNLTLLCWYPHHVVIHQEGFTLDPDTPPGRRRLIRPAPDRDPPHG
ncbi:MAG: HNH endonuclease, partial [Acidimicrobiia bacterium]|nr:HNH endonuclease [Acidimicrobiia bacterium]